MTWVTPTMRYTKIALLIFGLGLILGLVIVAGEYSAWERTASAVMALGLILIPVGLFADGRGMVIVAWLAGWLSRRKRNKPPTKTRAPAPRRKQPVQAAARPPGRKTGHKRSR